MNQHDWLWVRRSGDRVKAVVIPPTGDVVIREPTEGWSPRFSGAVLQHYFSVQGSYPHFVVMKTDAFFACLSSWVS
jgi:hypothetical protein